MYPGSFRKFLRNEVWKQHLKSGRCHLNLASCRAPAAPFHPVFSQVKPKGFRGMKCVPINFPGKKKKRKKMGNSKGSKEQVQSFSEELRWADVSWWAVRAWLWGVCAPRIPDSVCSSLEWAWNVGRAKSFVFPLLLLRSISFSTRLLCCRLHALAARRSCLSSGKIFFFHNYCCYLNQAELPAQGMRPSINLSHDEDLS